MNFSVTKLLVVALFFAAVGVACERGAEGNRDSRPADSSAPIAGTTVQPGTRVTAPAGVPAGWKSFSTPGLELWLPRSYEGGEPTKGDIDLIIRRLQASGARAFADIVEAQRSQSGLELLLINNDPKYLGASVNVVHREVPSALSIDALAAQFEALLTQQSGARLVDKISLSINSRPALRLQSEFDLGSTKTTVLQYGLKSGNDLWIVTSGSIRDGFEDLKLDFERSAQSIAIRQ